MSIQIVEVTDISHFRDDKKKNHRTLTTLCAFFIKSLSDRELYICNRG